MAKTGRDVGRGIMRAGTALDRAQKDAPRRAAVKAELIHQSELERVVPSGRLRNVGKNGAKLSVRYDIKGTRNPTALITALGPWQFIESDTKAHPITSRYAGGSRAARGRRVIGASISSVLGGGNVSTGLGGGAKAVLNMGGDYRRFVRHPGTKGKHPFRKGRNKAYPVIVKELHSTFTAVVRQELRY